MAAKGPVQVTWLLPRLNLHRRRAATAEDYKLQSCQPIDNQLGPLQDGDECPIMLDQVRPLPEYWDGTAASTFNLTAFWEKWSECEPLVWYFDEGLLRRW